MHGRNEPVNRGLPVPCFSLTPSISLPTSGPYPKASGNKCTSTVRRHKEESALMKHAIKKSSVDDCARIKNLGYASSHHIRMYGQKLEIVSDPVPDGNGVSVQVTSEAEPTKRTMRLPTSLLVGLKDLFPKVA